MKLQNVKKKIEAISEIVTPKTLNACWYTLLLIITACLIIIGISYLFLLPIFKKILMPPMTDVQMCETILNNANFVIVYISFLFTILGILLLFSNKELNRIAMLRKDTEVELKKTEDELNKVRQFRDTVKKNFFLESQLTTAKVYCAQGDFSEAWERIKNLPEDLNYEVPLYKAIILMNQKVRAFSRILQFLNKALDFSDLNNENKAIIYRHMGDAYVDKGDCENNKSDYEKALEYMEKAINENPGYWAAHNGKAMALKRLRKMDEAIKILEEVIVEERNYALAYYNLACYYSLESKERPNLKAKAIERYKEAIRLNPKLREFAKTDVELDNIRSEIKDL